MTPCPLCGTVPRAGDRLCRLCGEELRGGAPVGGDPLNPGRSATVSAEIRPPEATGPTVATGPGRPSAVPPTAEDPHRPLGPRPPTGTSAPTGPRASSNPLDETIDIGDPIPPRYPRTSPIDMGPTPTGLPDWVLNRRVQSIVAGTALVVLVLAVGTALIRPGGGGTDSDDVTTVQEQPVSTTTDLYPDTYPYDYDYDDEYATPTATTPTETVDEEEAALVELDRLADEGLATAELDGQWVAQLSSKAPGVTDDYQTTGSGSSTFEASDILEQAEELLARSDLGTTFVLRSTDYGKRQTYGGEALWVVFADDGFSSADAVRSWCEDHFPYTGDELLNACTARRLRA